jgi:uncharacterized damage-inducible protein DinB
MSDALLPLSIYYKGWDVYQQKLVSTIAPLTPEQLDLRTAPHMWSVGFLATHVIVARIGWFHYWMGVGSADLESMAGWDEDGEPLRNAAELVTGLNVTWQMISDALAGWTAADLDPIFTDPFPRPGTENNPRKRNRQWIIWHVLEHDLYHGGEISQALGTHNVTGMNL